jgi:hypothetical protein
MAREPRGRARSERRARRSAEGTSIRNGRIVGVVFCLAGFIAIGLGWNEASRLTCVDCQLPYLLSAGAGGIGSIVFGVGILLIAELRTVRMRLTERLRQPVEASSAEDAAGSSDRNETGDEAVDREHLPDP